MDATTQADKSAETTTAAGGAAPGEPKSASKPSAIAFNVRQGGEGKRNFWIRCGVEFAHDDGKGSTILVNVMPLDGRITVRAEADADKATAEAAEVPAADKAAKAPSKAPDQIAYSVRDVKGGRSFWTEVGIVYKHRDGRGKQIVLNALPLDGRLVLRDRAERVSAEPPVAGEADAK